MPLFMGGILLNTFQPSLPKFPDTFCRWTTSRQRLNSPAVFHLLTFSQGFTTD